MSVSIIACDMSSTVIVTVSVYGGTANLKNVVIAYSNAVLHPTALTLQ